MRYAGRFVLALGVVGAVAVAGVAFGQNGTPSPDASAAPDGAGHPHGPFPGHRGMDLGRIVTGTGTFQTDDGLVTRKIDAGEVTGVSGDAITIERADGQRVTVTIADDTIVRRDRETVGLGDIQTGDLARIMQLDSGDGFVVKAVLALSPDAQAQMESRRADRSAQMEQFRERMRQRRADRQADAATTTGTAA